MPLKLLTAYKLSPEGRTTNFCWPGRLMIKTRGVRLVTVTVLASAFCLLAIESRTATLDAPSRPVQQEPTAEKTAEQVYKNIQVLKDLRATDLDGAMNFMCAALGVGCTYCHTNPWDSDVKSAKLAARRMILMTRSINSEHFSSNPAVTCYTCHRGQHNSVPNPPADLAALRSTDDESTTPRPRSLPSTDDIISRYIRAIGGEAAIAKLKTRVSRGTETTTNRMTPPQMLPIEILQAAPDKLLIVRSNPRGATSDGFDGAKGWSKDAGGHRELIGKDLAEMKSEADFFKYLKIRETYPQIRVLAKEKIGDREAFVVGATSRYDTREKLYFDVETGLLMRQFVAFKTAFGSIPEVTGFDDYRVVSGVKLPFTITWSRPPFGFVRQFAEIRLNAIVDGVRFQSDAR